MPGAQITRRALGSAMKQLMTQKPFARISVGDVCELCGMSRKSFYYHFRDKHDLVNWIFSDDLTQLISREQPKGLWQFFHGLCLYLQQNRAFYVNAFAVEGQNALIGHFSQALHPIVLSCFRELFPQGEDNEFLALFYTDAIRMSLLRWLRDEQPLDPEEYVKKVRLAVSGIAQQAAAMGRERETLGERSGALPRTPQGGLL